MSTRQDISKTILELLSRKKAISTADIKEALGSRKDKKSSPRAVYAVSRAIGDLTEGGYIEALSGGQGNFLRLTKEGKKRASSHKLDSKNSLVSKHWDGKWRIILLDLPESRKAERESLRYLLKKAGFVCLKNSAWISPYPFEYLFENIKKDLDLTSELMIIVTERLDEATEKEFLASFGK